MSKKKQEQLYRYIKKTRLRILDGPFIGIFEHGGIYPASRIPPRYLRDKSYFRRVDTSSKTKITASGEQASGEKNLPEIDIDKTKEKHESKTNVKKESVDPEPLPDPEPEPEPEPAKKPKGKKSTGDRK